MKAIMSRDELSKLLKTEKYVLIDFTATWCAPCQSIRPILEWFGDAEEYAKLKIVSVDVDKFHKLSNEYNIHSIPCLCFMQDGKIVKKFEGLPQIEALRKYVREFIGLKPTMSNLVSGWT